MAKPRRLFNNLKTKLAGFQKRKDRWKGRYKNPRYPLLINLHSCSRLQSKIWLGKFQSVAKSYHLSLYEEKKMGPVHVALIL